MQIIRSMMMKREEAENRIDQGKRKMNNGPKPEWLKAKMPSGHNYFKLKRDLEEKNLFTICQSAKCPNIGECWNHSQATFLIMGTVCSRNCLFCSVTTGIPETLDPLEPEKILNMVQIMKLKYLVITSVTRDDLKDCGSSHFAEVIATLKINNPDLRIEVLIPDFKGNLRHVNKILGAKPDVINHNLETVKSLYPKINRNPENYHNSLKTLNFIKQKNFLTKSGIMVGLGETLEEILDLLTDLQKTGVKLLTIGQYLQPTVDNLPVEKYYTPIEFRQLKEMALSKGFKTVESGPFVRSSYHAGAMYEKVYNLSEKTINGNNG